MLPLEQNKIREQSSDMLRGRTDSQLFGDLTAMKKKAEKVERDLDRASSVRDRVVSEVREKEMQFGEIMEKKEMLCKILEDIIRMKSEEKGRVMREALEVEIRT